MGGGKGGVVADGAQQVSVWSKSVVERDTSQHASLFNLWVFICKDYEKPKNTWLFVSIQKKVLLDKKKNPIFESSVAQFKPCFLCPNKV